MSIEVTSAETDDLERWDSYVERSAQGWLFHQLSALRTQADHAGGELHLLVGHKGQEPVGIFPVFELRKGPIPTAFSPPPDLRVPTLGPALLNMDKLKRRKAERRHRQFVEGCLEWMADEIGPWYAHVRTATEYPDLRPFIWEGAEVSLNHTYAVDLSREADDLLAAFSRDARSNVTGEYDTPYTVDIAGRDALGDILEQVRERYRAQGKSFELPTGFVLDLYDALPEGQVRPYVLSVDGSFVGGIVALRYGETVARWQGGVRTDTDVDLPVNDLLDWAVMRDGVAEGLAWYDLVGADTPRLNEYKAKFDPELHTVHGVETGARPVIELAHAYERVK